MPRTLRSLRRALALAGLALAFPASAAALTFEIDNQSARPPGEVFVTVTGNEFDVTGMEDNVPKALSEIPGGELEIQKLVSGRVYVSYGAAVTEGVTLDSPVRFDWAELTVTPSASDVANLTAVDQFGIGMRLDTFGPGGTAGAPLETVAAANSNTIFSALQQIPGGPEATVRGSGGQILRVISPNKAAPGVYPTLEQFVRSMAGETIGLHTAFFGSPFTTSTYSGTFAADGSILLRGNTNPPGGAPPTLSFAGSQIVADVYTGGNTPNNLEGAIYRDLLAGFSTGLWGGRYGNNALGFCTNPVTDAQGSWCPTGFNQPSFGDARASLSPFPTCEQYAAVINQYSDMYGNPYSDASKRVTVGLRQPGDGGQVETLRLTIQPDSGTAQPVTGGNPNCGAAPTPTPVPARPISAAARFAAKAKVRGRSARVGRLVCSGPCGRYRAVAKRGQQVIARGSGRLTRPSGPIRLTLTAKAKRALKRSGELRAKVTVWITPAAQKPVRKGAVVTFLK